MADFLSLIASVFTIIASLLSIGMAFYSSYNAVERSSSLIKINVNNYNQKSTKNYSLDSDIIIEEFKDEYLAYKKSKFFIFIGSFLFSAFNISLIYSGWADLYVFSKIIDSFINEGVFSKPYLFNSFAFIFSFLVCWAVFNGLLEFFYESKLSAVLKNIGYSRNRNFLEKLRSRVLASSDFSNSDIYPLGTLGKILGNLDTEKRNNRLKDKSKGSSERYFIHHRNFYSPVLALTALWFLYFIFISHKLEIYNVSLKSDELFLKSGYKIQRNDYLRLINSNHNGLYPTILENKTLAWLDFASLSVKEPIESFTKDTLVTQEGVDLFNAPFYSENGFLSTLTMWDKPLAHKSTNKFSDWVLILTDDHKQGFIEKKFIELHD